MKHWTSWALGALLLCLLVAISRRESGTTVLLPESYSAPDVIKGQITAADDTGFGLQRKEIARIPVDLAERVSSQVTEHELGCLVVRVETVDGVPMELASVLLHDEEKGTFAECTTNVQGLGVFEGLSPGLRYRLEILESSLPEGWMPPLHQETCGSMGSVAYVYGTCFSFPHDQSKIEQALQVFPVSRVFGRVLGPFGEPVPGIPVRLQAKPYGAEGLALDAVTDTDGRFAFLRVLPSSYVFQAYPVRDTPYYGLSRPRHDLAVSSFDDVILPDLVFFKGPAAVSGKVIDQDGAPVENLAVLCFAYPGRWDEVIMLLGTDSGGCFVLDGLPTREVGIKIGPTGYSGYRDLLVTHPLESIPLDLRINRSVDLGVIRVSRDRPFVVTGHLCIQESYRDMAKFGSFSVTALTDDGRRERVRIEHDTGRFMWTSLDTSLDGALMSVSFEVFFAGCPLPGCPREVVEAQKTVIPVDPEPDASVDLQIEFPFQHMQ